MFNAIPEIIEDFKKGRMIIVIDDEDRENEGDLVIPASFVRPEDINFMAKYGRGLICVAMEEDHLRSLGIKPMILEQNDKRDKFSTAWMVSVDAANGITTGISAYDRAHTISLLTSVNSKPEDFISPGHLFPLRARNGGVLVRAGHTEAAVDLARLAGLAGVGVICEIMNEDGSMSRTEQLVEFAKKHKLKICTIADLIKYRSTREIFVKRVSQAKLPTEFGDFNLIAYESIIDGGHHLAIVMGDLKDNNLAGGPVLVRVHSECLTGDVFFSRRCDCGEQLRNSLKMIKTRERAWFCI